MSYNPSVLYKPSVAIISDLNPISLSLVNFFLKNRCVVAVFTNEPRKWNHKVRAIKSSDLLIKSLKQNDYLSFSYGILIEGFDQDVFRKNYLKKLEKRLPGYFDVFKNISGKKIVVLPYYQLTDDLIWLDGFVQKNLTDNTIKLVYLGEIYGVGVALNNFGLVSRIFNCCKDDRPITVPRENFKLYFVYISDVVHEIARIIFSFGARRRRLLIAEETTYLEFAKKVSENYKEGYFTKDVLISSPKVAKIEERLKPRITEKNSINKTLFWIKKTSKKTKKFYLLKPQKIKKSKTQKLVVERKYLALFSSLIFAFFIIPFLSLVISFVFTAFSYRSFYNNWPLTKSLLLLSQRSSGLSKSVFTTYTKIPLIGRAFDKFFSISSVFYRMSTLGQKTLDTLEDSYLLAYTVLGEGEQDIEPISHKIYLNLDYIYKESSFLQSELESFGFVRRYFSDDLSKFAQARKLLQPLSVLTKQLPVLLGVDIPTTYLVLFQNNMELRPTGGFIGSYALVTFDKGKLIDIDVDDVYSADGQLKGHVEPPEPIKNYLGEANWYLRDSNWDPDFPTSAKRAEWFFEKEMDRKVDGVVAVDLEFVKLFLKKTGPVNLHVLNEVVDHNNLYERIQYEVESEFFPGSRKKETVLTALSDGLVDRLRSFEDKKDFIIFSEVLKTALSSRNIQIFLHDKKSSQAISDLGWDGSIEIVSCNNNCHFVVFGLTEANLGVNKANYFIKRTMSFHSRILKDIVVNSLWVRFENNADISDLKGRYKVYIRLITGQNSGFGKVEVLSENDRVVLTPEVKKYGDRSEGGVLVEVGPRVQKTIVFNWYEPVSFDFSKAGRVDYFWRKQAGTLEDDIYLRIDTPDKSGFAVSGFFLTKDGSFVYNNKLFGDFSTTVSWR